MMEAGVQIRPFRATVDLARIRHNVTYLKGLTKPGCLLMAVVKANAYGHGDLEVSRAALTAGADWLGVALVEEGERLRAAGFTSPIFLFFEPPPRGAAAAVGLDLTCAVYTEDFARALSAAAVKAGKVAGVHLKVDTGMRRVGVKPEEALPFASMLGGLEGISLDGIYTHFAVATEPEDPYTALQIADFEATSRAVEEVAQKALLKHAANSAGVMAFPRSHYDMVRVGIAMMGLAPSPSLADERLRPALTLGGEVAFVKKVGAHERISYGLTYAPGRDSWIATLPAGYADGVSRSLSNKGEVLIAGRRYPLAGTVCMDMCMADLGADRLTPGTPFLLIGEDAGERITADEVADRIGTINYEVTCMISSRVPRVFIDSLQGGPR